MTEYINSNGYEEGLEVVSLGRSPVDISEEGCHRRIPSSDDSRSPTTVRDVDEVYKDF